MRKAVALSSVLLFTAFTASSALAAEFPFGLWRVADGTAVIRVSPCGGAVCGYVAAAPKPEPGEKSAVGRKILLNLRRSGDSWHGPILNLDDGKTYQGSISQGGDANHLKIQGCAGGGICGGETWRRVR